ncbi:MAG: sulfite exporter TauE/SafE family protein [Pseudomonadota bacterium]
MAELSTLTLIVLFVAAFLTGVLHGSVGLAGGVVMAAILAHAIGIKAAVPVMTCALLFSHGSRVLLFRRATDWSTATLVLLFGLPTIVLGAWVFTRISEVTIALVFALFLACSLPVKRWANARQLKTSRPVLAGASAIWGMLAGNVIGPGFFLAPFLLGTGMNRLTFVGTMAVITLVMNAAKLAVFSAGALIDTDGLILGVLIGLFTVPGNWLGKRVLTKMTDRHHGWLIDVFTILLIINFLYLAVSGGAS